MPDIIHTANARNDEVLERICLGRRYYNDA